METGKKKLKEMELVIIRGLPGSGKTTEAKKMEGYEHFEADQYFEIDGCYKYDRDKVSIAHEWCMEQIKQAFSKGKTKVVVSNTFSRIWEMQPYLGIAKLFGVSVHVIEAKGNYQNIHNVPDEIIERMRQRWETIPADFCQAVNNNE